MTLRKFNPEATSTESHPFNVGVTFQHELIDLAEAIVKTRAIRAFESAATRYPIHREFRCAARRALEEVFDDLALDAGLAPQRLDTGSLLLDGPGVFIHAEGRRRADYCSCTFNVWADSKARAEEARETLFRVVGDRRIRKDLFVLDWYFSTQRSGLSSASFEEVAEDVLHDEAYPMLGEPVDAFIARYLAADETVLIVQGPPGTGKTRFVRAILAALSRRRGDSAEILYTCDKRALESDRIFVDFITGAHEAFVVEDADHLLRTRASGNDQLHRFLAVADGIVRAQGRKIIFTTNLPNVGDIDDALLRPGRCFANLRTRALERSEAERLVERLCAGKPDLCDRIQTQVLPKSVRLITVAALYQACAHA